MTPLDIKNGLRGEYFKEQFKDICDNKIDSELHFTFAQDSTFKTVRWCGFIEFDTAGEKILTLNTKGKYMIRIGLGIHYTRVIRDTLGNQELDGKFSVVTGIQYDLIIEYIRPDIDDTLNLNISEGNYKLFISHIYKGNHMPPIQPVMDMGMRDCMVMLGNDGTYYMTGTSGPDFWNNNDGIHIYKSENLKDWSDIGLVWDVEKDSTWQKRRDQDGRRPVWAPELHYFHDTYWLTYSMGWWDGMCSSILKSTTGNVEGPYIDVNPAGPIFDTIDNSIFVDYDDSVYVIYGNCRLVKMKDDMSGQDGPTRNIVAEDGAPIGFEGCFILKHDGKYILSSALTNYDGGDEFDIPWLQSYDAVYAVSDNLFGPYGQRKLLMRNAGHNNLFKDRDNNLWTTLFISHDNNKTTFLCKPAMERLIFAENGDIKVARYLALTIPVFDESFSLIEIPEGQIFAAVHVGAPSDVYINGIFACKIPKENSYCLPLEISQDARNSLLIGQNSLKVVGTNLIKAQIEVWKTSAK